MRKLFGTGTSVIGTELTLLGDRITVISKNWLQVDGDIRGNVHGRHVVITEEGSGSIEVRGGVRGSIRAVSVKLQATAQVEGDITHQKLFIAEGAEFTGCVSVSKDVGALMPVLIPKRLSRRAARPRAIATVRGPLDARDALRGAGSSDRLAVRDIWL